MPTPQYGVYYDVVAKLARHFVTLTTQGAGYKLTAIVFLLFGLCGILRNF